MQPVGVRHDHDVAPGVWLSEYGLTNVGHVVFDADETAVDVRL